MVIGEDGIYNGQAFDYDGDGDTDILRYPGHMATEAVFVGESGAVTFPRLYIAAFTLKLSSKIQKFDISLNHLQRCIPAVII